MDFSYMGLNEINGSLIVLDHVADAAYDEIVKIETTEGKSLLGKVIAIEDQRAVIQVYEGTKGLSLTNTKTKFTGRPMELALSKEILGRIFDGAGKPIDGLGEIYAEKKVNVNGVPINPVSREYPRNYIQTGFSCIDGMSTLIRGQKLPIFSGSGMKHNQFAAQIAAQAKVTDNSEFAIVFAAMGVKNDVADFFKNSFAQSGALSKVVMFLNLANDPII